MLSYIVVPGDSFTSIASRNGITLAQLFAANPDIANPNILYIGQTLSIPTASIAATPASSAFAAAVIPNTVAVVGTGGTYGIVDQIENIFKDPITLGLAAGAAAVGYMLYKKYKKKGRK